MSAWCEGSYKTVRCLLTQSELNIKSKQKYPIFRLHYIKRVTIRKKRDVELLKTRLDVYNDEWRTAQPDPITKIKMPTNLTPTGKVRKSRLKKNNGTAPNPPPPNECETKPIDAKLSKRKRSKSDKVRFFTVITFFLCFMNSELEE